MTPRERARAGGPCKQHHGPRGCDQSQRPVAAAGRQPRSAPMRELSTASAMRADEQQRLQRVFCRARRTGPVIEGEARAAKPPHARWPPRARGRSSRPCGRSERFVHRRRNRRRGATPPSRPAASCDAAKVQLPQRRLRRPPEYAPAPFAAAAIAPAACRRCVWIAACSPGPRAGNGRRRGAPARSRPGGPGQRSGIADIEDAVAARFDGDGPHDRETARIAERDLSKQARIELGRS